MNRRFRLLTAVTAAAALLFAQLAVAAYACPNQVQVPAVEATCEHDVSITPNLCVQHCYGDASVGSAQSAPAAPDQAAVVFALPSLVVAPLPEHRVLRSHSAAAHPPPIFIRCTVLRI